MSTFLDITNAGMQNSFKTLQEFKLLEELPGAKPLVVVTDEGQIVYATNAFVHEFGIADGVSVEGLLSEPSIAVMVNNLVKSKYRAIQVEASVKNNISGEMSGYLVDIERIIIDGGEYLFLVFSSSVERRQFENRINILHNALDYGDIPVLVLNRTGRITYATRSFEDILDKRIDELYNAYLPDILQSYLNPGAQSGLSYALENKSSWRQVICDSSKVWYKELHLNPVSYTYSDAQSFIMTAHDITGFIQKNTIIEESEKRQRSIINNISDVLLIIRPHEGEYLIENANDKVLTKFDGYKDNYIIGAHEVIISDDLYSEICISVNGFENSQKQQISFQYNDILKEHIYQVKMTYTDESLTGERLYIIALTDITDQLLHEENLRRAYEKETQLNKLKSAFLANMSHEIRTPSMAIVGYANLLCDDAMSGYYDSIPEMTGYLKDGIKRLLKLIDNIVEVSMIESGDYGFEFTPGNFNKLVLSSIEDLLPMAEEKKITVHHDFDESMPEIEIDQLKAKKIIEAIVDNAVKYNVMGGKVMLKSIYSDN
ncbi:MAG: PAS domain-containing protein, partial [Ignavibacteriales bacterium]|nr:PAS domain-containing protein [Ignavibacteriales bacterium]